MIYLLDTHALIWSIINPDKLSKVAHKIIEDQKNTILVSSISFWEISLKYSLHKIELDQISPEQFPGLAKEIGFDLIPLMPDEVSGYHQLKGSWHKDPFDKMLIWQAIQRNIPLISKDENIAKYSAEGLKIIW